MAEAKRKPEAAGFFLGLIQATSPLAPLRWCKNRDENLPGLPTFPLSSLGQRSEGGLASPSLPPSHEPVLFLWDIQAPDSLPLAPVS